MPIIADQMNREDMEQAVRDRALCGECQAPLSMAWSNIGWILRCGKDINHSTITRRNHKYEQELRRNFSMDSTALMTMTEAKMIERVNMARFPQELTIQDKKLLAQVAITYGFDPLMGEVTIYQGRPWVSIDGRYRKAQETGCLDGVETRPATKQEREDWQIPEGDYFFRSEVFVKGAARPFVAWGRVFMTETIGGKGFKPVEKNPQRMAEKRAEAQALRKAFHIPLPSAEDIGSPEESTVTVTIDKTTGEIKDQPEAKPMPATDQEIKAVKAKARAKGYNETTWKEALFQTCALGTIVGISKEQLAKLDAAIEAGKCLPAGPDETEKGEEPTE